MKQLDEYLKYNLWANQIIAGCMEKAGDEKLDIYIESSFPSIRKTWYHIWDAQSIWVARLEARQQIVAASFEFKGKTSEAINLFLKSSEDLIKLGNQLETDRSLTYKNTAGKEYTNQVWQILMHVVNHGTYHRGQLITLLRQVGMTGFQPLDFIAYCRL
ncbi:MAG: DinB family protein [Bacteroidia bacterium]|nr:hypothetical protein [Bacteroidia bacterium]MCZ2277497.1 DinB family protein [Bacteroidia bacterium]